MADAQFLPPLWWMPGPSQQLGTLQSRMRGGPVSKALEPALDAFKALLQNDTEHQSVVVKMFHRLATDSFHVTVRCNACKKQWVQTWGMEEIERHTLNLLEWVRYDLVAYYELIAGEACYGVMEAALLAEWITTKLAAAGEQGMPYAQVVHEAVAGRMVPPKDVDWMLRKMKFVESWVRLENSGVILPSGWDGEWTLPILTLPEGHPLRRW